MAEFLPHLVVQISKHSTLLRGGLTPIILWAFWFYGDAEKKKKNRPIIIKTLISAIFALFFLWMFFFAVDVPFEERYRCYILGMSSAIVTGIFFLSWAWGVLSALYVLSFVFFPYSGYSSLIAIFLGLLISFILSFTPLLDTVGERILRWQERASALFYLFFFLIVYQMTNLLQGISQLWIFKPS